MRITLFAAVALASTALATPAFAQDTAADTTFTGPRVAVLGGYDGIRPGSSEDSDVDGDDQTVDGFLYGVELGYDFDLGNAVVGVEGEISDSTGKVEVNSSDPDYFGFGRVSTGRDLYLGARVGFKASPQTLIYAKGGYTNTKLNVLATDGTTELDSSFKLDGWRLGAGVEQNFGRNLFAKVEYRYSNYSDAKFEYTNGSASSDFDIDTDRHQVVAGVGVRF